MYYKMGTIMVGSLISRFDSTNNLSISQSFIKAPWAGVAESIVACHGWMYPIFFFMDELALHNSLLWMNENINLLVMNESNFYVMDEWTHYDFMDEWTLYLMTVMGKQCESYKEVDTTTGALWEWLRHYGSNWWIMYYFCLWIVNDVYQKIEATKK
jgi:hypothetical protein